MRSLAQSRTRWRSVLALVLSIGLLGVSSCGSDSDPNPNQPPTFYSGKASQLYCGILQEYVDALASRDFDRFAMRLLSERQHASNLVPCIEHLHGGKVKNVPDMSACLDANQWAREMGITPSESCVSPEAAAATFLDDLRSVLQGLATWDQTTSGLAMAFVIFGCETDPNLASVLCPEIKIASCSVECDQQ